MRSRCYRPGRYSVRYRCARPRSSRSSSRRAIAGRCLQQCLRSLEEKTTYTRYEIIVLDNDSTEPETIHGLRAVAGKCRVLAVPGRVQLLRASTTSAPPRRVATTSCSSTTTRRWSSPTGSAPCSSRRSVRRSARWAPACTTPTAGSSTPASSSASGGWPTTPSAGLLRRRVQLLRPGHRRAQRERRHRRLHDGAARRLRGSRRLRRAARGRAERRRSVPAPAPAGLPRSSTPRAPTSITTNRARGADCIHRRTRSWSGSSGAT